MTRSLLNLLLLTLTILLSCKKQSKTQIVTDQPSDSWVVDTATITMPRSNGLAVNESTLSNGMTTTLVILGSSTAEGIGATNRNLSWAELLRTKLVIDNKGVNVINLGLGGQTTYNIMPTGFKAPVGRDRPNAKRNITSALSYHPFLVIINMPTNDIASNFTDDEIINNFDTIIKAIDSAKTNYILTGTQPRNFATLEDRKRLKSLNDKLKSLYPGHIVDILKKLSKPTYLIAEYYAYTDGVHLNDDGHKVIYQYIFNFPLFQQLIGYVDFATASSTDY